MRTTVDLDEDVLVAVKERARREKRTAGQVLSELARQSLTGGDTGRQEGGREHHGFRSLPRRGGAVSNALIDALREDGPE